jgi:tetratricopeptide (TPR) repeat protein
MNGILPALFLFLLAICRADTIPVVRGAVESDDPLMGPGFTVELQAAGPSPARSQSPVGGDGSFEFRDVTPGLYLLRVNNMMGSSLVEQTVNLNQNSVLTLRLPKSTARSTGDGSVVSAQRLRQPVPKKALRAFIDAQRASESGRRGDAIAKLEQAIRIFPEYSEARSNLGVQYIRTGRLEAAVEQFDMAIAAGPPSELVYSNLAYALIALRRTGEGEEAARRAIVLDSSAGMPRFLLGSILAEKQKFDEALYHLRFAARAIPKAHLQIAKIEQGAGHRAAAEAELQLYLKSGDPVLRPSVERWLSALRSNR